MILVDSSVWISFLRGIAGEAVARLRSALERNTPVAITSGIYQEILQGTDSERSFAEYQAYFASQLFLHPGDATRSFANAAKLYFDCRRAGFTIRSTTDCLIAQIAIEHGARLLHNDRDFELIAKVAPKLKLA